MLKKIGSVIFQENEPLNKPSPKQRREQLQIKIDEMTKDMDESKRRVILGPRITDLLKKMNREQLNEFQVILEKKSAI